MACNNCNKILKKSKSIINGYTNLVSPNPEVELLAAKRLEVCNTCKFNKTFGIANIHYCSKCFCVIQAKVRSLEENCNLWK